MNKKQKILITASTFPRWKGDKIPLFIYELALSLLNDYEVRVLAPHYKGAKQSENFDGILVHRFIYFPQFGEVLAYEGGAINNIKNKPLINFLIPFYFFSNLIWIFYLNFKYKFKIIIGIKRGTVPSRSIIPVIGITSCNACSSATIYGCSA